MKDRVPLELQTEPSGRAPLGGRQAAKRDLDSFGQRTRITGLVVSMASAEEIWTVSG